MKKNLGKLILCNCNDLIFEVYIYKIGVVFLKDVCEDFSLLVVFVLISVNMLIYLKIK